MLLIPPPVNIKPDDGFTEENDIFGYEKFGENMMNIIAANAASEFVMLLDGAWGTGKSVFAKQWAGFLRGEDFPVIEFDAFRNDYQEDAFIAFAGEVYDLGKEKLDGKKDIVSSFLDKAKKAGAVLAPALVKAGVRAATAGLINTEDMGESVKASIDAISDDGGEAIEKIISKQLENRNSERNALDSFSTSLGEIAAVLSGGREDRPLVIIVDELDRCKPTFALNILERIKHLFSTKGVVFVLVANSEQLRDTVTKIYGGSDISGAKYLEKFYHVRATLPESKLGDRCQKYAEYLWPKLADGTPATRAFPMMISYLAEAGHANNNSLRIIERVATNVVLAYQMMPATPALYTEVLFGLCLLRHVDSDAFGDALSGTLSPERIIAASQCNKWAEGDPRVYFERTWTTLLEPRSTILTEIDRKHADMLLDEFDFRSGVELVKAVAKELASFDIK